MKKFALIFLIISIVFSVGIFVSLKLYTKMNLDALKEEIIDKHPEINQIYSINHSGGYQEWNSEYTLVVALEGKRYRIWTDQRGKITDKLLLEQYTK